MDASEFPRQLNKSERDTLNYLLATDFPESRSFESRHERLRRGPLPVRLG